MASFLGSTQLERRFAIHFLLSRAWFLGSFWVIYLISKGFTLVTAAFLDIVFWSALFLFEIPTGYIADFFGRKVSLVSSYLLQTLAIMLFGLASTLPMFLLSYGIWGLSLTLQSGAEEAWIYDEIVFSTGSDDTYQEVYGNLIGLGFISLAISGILGGIIAEIELVYTIYATAMIFGLTAIWVLFIPHHYIPTRDKEDRPSLSRSFRSLGAIKFLAILLILVNAGMVVVTFWFQTYLDSRSVEYIYIGIILGIGAAFVSLGGKLSERVSDRIGHNSITILPVFLGLLMVMLSFGLYPAILSYFIIHIFRGLWFPLMSKSMNTRLQSKVRATVLSIVGALSTIFILAVEIGSAIFIEKVGYNLTYTISGVTMLILVGIIFGLRQAFHQQTDDVSDKKDKNDLSDFR